MIIETNVSLEHIVETTIPNSIYCGQGKKIHKPSLMVIKFEHPSDIFEIAFKLRLERVSDAKTRVKVIYKRSQMKKVAAESDPLLTGIATYELV